MPLTPHGPAPYTTAAAATLTLDAWRDRGLGVPVTADVLARAGIPETLGNRTILSLKQLDLLDETGKPTQQFEDLRLARGVDEYQSRLQEWIRAVYADVLQYTDPSVDSQSRVAEAFRTYEPGGQRKAMALLLIGLWKYAGLPVPEPEKGGTRANMTVSENRRPPKVLRGVQPRKRPDLGKGTKVDDDLPPGLIGLLQQIPRGGKGWTKDNRANFLTAFTAVLDFTVPVRPEGLEDFTDADAETDANPWDGVDAED